MNGRKDIKMSYIFTSYEDALMYMKNKEAKHKNALCRIEKTSIEKAFGTGGWAYCLTNPYGQSCYLVKPEKLFNKK